MLRSLTLLFCCSLLLFSCKNKPAETTTQDHSDSAIPQDDGDSAVPTATTPPNTSLIKSGDSEEMIAIKKGLAAHLSSNLIESVDLISGKLTISYFKNAADYVAANQGKRMDDDLFQKYWSSGSRAEKVIILTPAKVLNSFSSIKSVETILHNGTNTWTSIVTRDDLAKHTKKSWAEIQEDFDQHVRYGLAAFPDARTAYIEAFVTKK